VRIENEKGCPAIVESQAEGSKVNTNGSRLNSTAKHCSSCIGYGLASRSENAHNTFVIFDLAFPSSFHHLSIMTRESSGKRSATSDMPPAAKRRKQSKPAEEAAQQSSSDERADSEDATSSDQSAEDSDASCIASPPKRSRGRPKSKQGPKTKKSTAKKAKPGPKHKNGSKSKKAVASESDSEEEPDLDPGKWFKIQFDDSWTRQDEESLRESWSDKDQVLLMGTSSQEYTLWRRCIKLFDALPHQLLPPGDCFEIGANKKLIKTAAFPDGIRNTNWPSEVCQWFSIAICCPVFRKRPDIVRYAVDKTLFHRLGPKHRKRPDQLELVGDRNDSIISALDHLYDFPEGAFDRVSEVLEEKLGLDLPPYFEFLEGLEDLIKRDETSKKGFTRKDARAICDAWNLYAEKPQHCHLKLIVEAADIYSRERKGLSQLSILELKKEFLLSQRRERRRRERSAVFESLDEDGDESPNDDMNPKVGRGSHPAPARAGDARSSRRDADTAGAQEMQDIPKVAHMEARQSSRYQSKSSRPSSRMLVGEGTAANNAQNATQLQGTPQIADLIRMPDIKNILQQPPPTQTQASTFQLQVPPSQLQAPALRSQLQQPQPTQQPPQYNIWDFASDNSRSGNLLFEQWRANSDSSERETFFQAWVALQEQARMRSTPVGIGGSAAPLPSSTNRFGSMLNEAPAPSKPVKQPQGAKAAAATPSTATAKQDKEEGGGGGGEGGETGEELEN
jgi:hypothetical protein